MKVIHAAFGPVPLRAMTATLALLGLAGCGPGYKVEFQNSSSITYWYDPARQSMGSVQNRAQEHCDQFGKDALPQASSGDRFTGISMSFICRPRGN